MLTGVLAFNLVKELGFHHFCASAAETVSFTAILRMMSYVDELFIGVHLTCF